MRKPISTLLIGLFITAAAASAALAVQGRAYVERERQIQQMAKAMDGDRREVKTFKQLLEDLDDCDISESTRDFWRIARDVKPAMERELAQITDRANEKAAKMRKNQVERSVQKAEMGEATPLDSSDATSDSPLIKRARHMEMLYREAEGLRNPMAMADPSVVKRYRLLVGQFYDEMKADIHSREAEIDRLRKENRR